MYDLTSEQRKAVETVGKSVCVSAGAGTGKTRVLVERFIRLIEKKLAKPDEILAVTFTEKAANEMKARIAGRLLECGLEEARRQLENAYIGTIHAFCSRVLREHPIEAGVDPAFRVLEEDEAGLLKESALDGLMEARFEEPDVFQLLRVYSESGVRESIKSIADRAHHFGLPFSKNQSAETESAGIKKRLMSAFNVLSALGDKAPLCAEMDELLARSVLDWKHLERIRQTAGKFHRRGPKKELISEFRNALDEWIAWQAEKLGGKQAETFLDLLAHFERRYQTRKAEHALLDFNDLERSALGLLEGSDAKSTACRCLYRNRFKFVMVDEYQDTSPIQDRLISLVSAQENLFIVGDWKQSIYSFRGADPGLLAKKEEIFLTSKTGDRVCLVQNFRSGQAVINFVNGFFDNLWKDKKFEPLEVLQTLDEKTAGDGVEWLVMERGKEDAVEEARMNEARMLAERIRDLVAEGRYQYKDFAMLFRAATDVFFYEYELRNLGIPYYVVSGRGFYQQPEIKDLISFLEVLENPLLDIPLAATLRSPLVQVSDDALFWLANATKRRDEKTPLFDAVLGCRDIAELSDQDRKRLLEFRDRFLKFLEDKEKYSVSETLEKWLDETRYDRYVLTLPMAKRRFANLRKLIDMANELESRRSLHLGDFIRYVKGLEREEIRESEAQVEALEGNAVKLMTIHKAKGLEFNVVILPDLNRKGEMRHGRFLADPEGGFGFQVFNEESRDFEETFSYLRIKDELIRRAQDESRRLLYVAMTRARRRLIFSGTAVSDGGEDKGISSDRERGGAFDDGANWFDWIHICSDDPKIVLDRRRVTPRRFGGGRPLLPLAQRKSIQAALGAGKAVKAKKAPQTDQILSAIEPIEPVYFERLDLPVSAYVAFNQSPEAYRHVYEVGVLDDQFEKSEEWVLADDEQTISPKDFGTLVHRIFEQLVLRPDQAAKRISELTIRFAGDLDVDARNEIKKLSERFVRSEQFKTIAEAGRRESEIPFALRLSNGIIQGTLDLLYETKDGKWIILDYKTSVVDERNLAEHAKIYRPQMMLYALACHELLGIRLESARLYFVRSGLHFDFDCRFEDYEKLKGEFKTLQREMIATRREWVV